MNNGEISRILDRIGILLEIKGENQFRVRAFQKAARAVGQFGGSIEEEARGGRLLSIDGVGKGISAEIEALLSTGESPSLLELFREIPPSILEIVEIPGIGPKRAAQLWREKGISSLEDLERAARGGVIERMKFFGGKSQVNILEGIAIKRQAMEQKSIGAALPLARDLTGFLASVPGVEGVSEAGELRRRAETVRSVPILVSSRAPGRVMEAVAGLGGLKSVEVSGGAAWLETAEGIRVLVEVAGPEAFGAGLLCRTGSADHVNGVMALLKEKGYLLGEEGLFAGDGSMIAAPGEEMIYEMAGLPFIPPEMRETGEELGPGVLEYLGELIDQGDIRGDLQMHSTYSDGAGSVGDMAEKAMELGYSYIALTDHSRSLAIANGMPPERLREQGKEIEALNGELAGRFRILRGAEVDILSDGGLDYPEELLRELDFVLVSVHQGMKMARDKMTKRIIRAIRHPMVHCLAHPSGRLIGRRPEMEMDWEEILPAARDAGIALEINAHPSRLDLDWHRCRAARDMGIPILINTDAHAPVQMELMEYGVFTARRGWLRKDDVLNTLPADRMEEWLRKVRNKKSGGENGDN
jgi:DNA polymerase (family 10)